MIKPLSIIFAIVFSGLNLSTALAAQQPTPTNQASIASIIDSPDTAALDIMLNALSSLKELRKQNKTSDENIKELIQIKILPYLAIDISTELALKKYWNNLTAVQKLAFQNYVINALINDYAGILTTYDKLDSIKIAVDPNVRRQDNKAIIKLIIHFNEQLNKPVIISLKMIYLNQWLVYDIAFSGVSLMKNYQAQFNSHIKRKGLESLIQKISN